jgi:hypothetical protein
VEELELGIVLAGEEIAEATGRDVRIGPSGLDRADGVCFGETEQCLEGRIYVLDPSCVRSSIDSVDLFDVNLTGSETQSWQEKVSHPTVPPCAGQRVFPMPLLQACA